MSSPYLLYYGDNLDILRRYLADESVDLVYLDPPFKSGQDYNILFAEKNGSVAASQILAFEDTWHWDHIAEAAFYEAVKRGDLLAENLVSLRKILGSNDMMAYLAMMAPRLAELHRVLKPTGSLYLHCDTTASHYLRLLLDAIFGKENFRNEIIWKRTSSHSDSRRWMQIHDILFFYTKNPGFTWNPIYLPHSRKYLKDFYRYQDKKGRYRLDHIIRSKSMGKRPNLTYEFRGYTPEYGWRVINEKLVKLEQEGRIEWSKTGRPYLKRYLKEQEGVPISSVITDIPPLSAFARERLGYPTQKPEALLERIISASSNPGDTVLDPFCGCGTTIAVSQRLNRRWIGIDITYLAISLIKNRLHDTFSDAAQFEVIGEPVSLPDAVALAKQDSFQFQWWALGLVNARPVEKKKGADQGIDGKLFFQVSGGEIHTVLFSVKSGHVTVKDIRDLRGTLERENAAIGALLTLEEPTQPMRSEAVSAGFYEAPGWNQRYPRLQILTITELLAGKTVERPPDNQTFKRAPKAKRGHKLDTLLF